MTTLAAAFIIWSNNCETCCLHVHQAVSDVFKNLLFVQPSDQDRRRIFDILALKMTERINKSSEKVGNTVCADQLIH